MTTMIMIRTILLVLAMSSLTNTIVGVNGQSLPNPPKPGDALDWSVPFPQWWHDLHEQYMSREVRKCEFLEFVPATNDRCPGVSRRDHYYCIYGTATEPTYFCTCVEKDEYVFHCDTQLRTVDFIRGVENGTLSADGTPLNTETLVNVTASMPSPSPAPTEVPKTTPPGAAPKPGDLLDWDAAEPQWWQDIKDQYKPREVRKCEFLEFVPDTSESCPGVSKFGHYYCIFGTETEATWFCTCLERNDFTFHCGAELQTPKQILHGGGAGGDNDESSSDEDATNSNSTSTSSGKSNAASFNSGFWTGFAVMGALVVGMMNLKRWWENRSARKSRLPSSAAFQHPDAATEGWNMRSSQSIS